MRKCLPCRKRSYSCEYQHESEPCNRCRFRTTKPNIRSNDPEQYKLLGLFEELHQALLEPTAEPQTPDATYKKLLHDLSDNADTDPLVTEASRILSRSFPSRDGAQTKLIVKCAIQCLLEENKIASGRGGPNTPVTGTKP